MCVGQDKLKNRCIQLAKKAIKEAFPNILTFTTHFTIKTFQYFFCFFIITYLPLFLLITTLPSLFYFYLPFSTSTSPILHLPHQLYLYLTPFYHLPHSCSQPQLDNFTIGKALSVPQMT